MSSVSVKPYPPLDLRIETHDQSSGSAHVSIELSDRDLYCSDPVVIQADCTSPPWTELEMLYCGLTSTNRHLYTMLYENIPVGPVHFRMRMGSKEILEPNFYKQVVDKDGLISHVVESWVFGDFTTLTPTESERSPLFGHEMTPDQSPRASVSTGSSGAGYAPHGATERIPWRRHRRQPSISLPTPPLDPGDAPLEPIPEEPQDTVNVGDAALTKTEAATGERERKDSSFELISC